MINYNPIIGSRLDEPRGLTLMKEDKFRKNIMEVVFCLTQFVRSVLHLEISLP